MRSVASQADTGQTIFMLETPSTAERKKAPTSRAALWLWLSVAAALLAMAGNVIALAKPGIYAHLTPAFFPQALAQDVANLALIGPFWLIVAALALRGSRRAYLLWLGALTFTVYNYAIYAFSVPFGPLFPLWVAVFGLSLFALIGGITGNGAADHGAVAASFPDRRAVAVVAWSLIVIAVLFAFLWLADDVPALLAGTAPQSLVDLGLPTNPVHVLDLGFFLPAVIATGVLLLKRRPLAYTLAPVFLVFLLLTGLPILLTPVVQTMRGKEAPWSLVPPIGILSLLVLALLVWLLQTMKVDPHRKDAIG